MLASTALYGVSGEAGFLIDSLSILLASRAILGIAVGGIMVTTTTLIADYFSGEQRDTVMGWQGATINLGGIVFLSLGGVLTDFGWQTPFLVYALSLLLLPMLAVVIHEPELDPVEGTESTSPLAGVREFLSEVPVLTLGTVYAITLLGSVLFYLMPIQIPFYLQTVTAASGALTGFVLASYNLSAMALSSQFQRVKARVGSVLLLALVFGLMGAGYVIIGLSTAALGIVIGLLVAGFGWGLLIPTANTWVSTSVTESTRGRALGVVSSMIFLGQFLSPIVSQPVVDRVSLATTYEFAGALMLLLAVAFVIGNRWHEPRHPGASGASSNAK